MRRLAALVSFLTLAVGFPGLSWSDSEPEGKPSVGAAAPSFSVSLMGGGTFDLAPYLGRNAILLEFWSIYCVACVEEMPRLVEIYDRYRDDGLIAVGIDLDSSTPKRVVKFVQGLPFRVTYPLVMDQRREVAAKYGVSVLPLTVVIDRSGKVLSYHVGYAKGDEAQIEKKVKEALGLKR